MALAKCHLHFLKCGTPILTKVLGILLLMTFCVHWSLAQTLSTKLYPPHYITKQIAHVILIKNNDSTASDMPVVLAFKCYTKKGILFNDTLQVLSNGPLEIASVNNLWNKNVDKEKYLAIMKLTNRLPVDTYKVEVETKYNGKSARALDVWYISNYVDENSLLYKEISTQLSKEILKNKTALQNISAKATTTDYTKLRLNEIVRKTISKSAQTLDKHLSVVMLANDEFTFYYDTLPIGSMQFDYQHIVKLIKGDIINGVSSAIKKRVDGEQTHYANLIEEMQKKVAGQGKENILAGDITSRTFLSTEQYENSDQLPNFQEFNANVDLDVLGIPIAVNGFWTSADKNRKVKSSYLRVQYDFAKIKSETVQTAAGIKGDVEDRINRSVMNVTKLNNSKEAVAALKNKLEIELKRQLDSICNHYADSLLKQQNIANIDSAHHFKDSMEQVVVMYRAQIEETHDKIRDIKNKIASYEEKLTTYEGMMHDLQQNMDIDTSILHGKLESIKHVSKDKLQTDLSNKLKRKLNNTIHQKFAKHLDFLAVGMFNNYVSRYTFGDQQMKGVGCGVTIHNSTVSVLGGTAQKISRYGTVEGVHLLNVGYEYAITPHNKIKIVYQNEQFAANEITLATGRSIIGNINRANQIAALAYQCKVAKLLQINSEFAYTLPRARDDGSTPLNFVAFKHSLVGAIPKTTITTGLEWEHIGRNFENLSMLFLRKNSNIISGFLEGSLLKNMLRYKASLVEMHQENTTSTGVNRRVGYEIKTSFKKYPKVLISFKPFTTFRNNFDTLTIAQAPLFGNVFTAKGNYAYKTPKGTHQMMLSINNNRSTVDTIRYRSQVIQASYQYRNTINGIYNLRFGAMNMPTLRAKNEDQKFVQVSGQYSITTKWQIMSLVDLNYIDKGQLNRFSTQGNINYTHIKYKIQVGIGCGYTSFLDASYLNKKIFNSTIFMTHTFKQKLN